MLYQERADTIIRLLKKQSIVKISELVSQLGVSVDTVRRDLKSLEAAGLVKCVHGGACLPDSSGQFSPFIYREIVNIELKTQAAVKALSFIREGDVIALNSGTTNAILAQQIAQKFQNITIITNNIAAVTILMGQPSLRVIVPGGFLDPAEKSLHGHECESALDKFITDVCFLSINAVSLEKGYTDFRFSEVDIMRILTRNAAKTIAVMDSSKLGKTSKQKVFGLDEVDILVTDDEADEEQRKAFLASGVNLV